MVVEARVTGIPDLKAALQAIPAKLRRRALRNALAAGARLIRDAARSVAPVLKAGRRAPYRRPGTVKKAIVVRTSRAARRAGDVGVFVNVRPLKAKQRAAFKGAGAKNPNDPFYWRFLEFGTNKMRAMPFLQPAGRRLADALTKFKAVIGPQIQKLNANPKDPL
jgi:HK97 gp10 family phage protein